MDDIEVFREYTDRDGRRRAVGLAWGKDACWVHDAFWSERAEAWDWGGVICGGGEDALEIARTAIPLVAEAVDHAVLTLLRSEPQEEPDADSDGEQSP